MSHTFNTIKKARVRTVLFDLGNVLVRLQPEMMAQTLGADVAEIARHEKEITELVRRYERGEIMTDEALEQMSDILQRKYMLDAIRQSFIAIIGKPIEGMDDLIRRTAKTSHVALVSNTNDLHYEYCRKAVPAMKLLPHHYVSFQIGAVKPEPAFYDYLLNDLECDPGEVLFIDDLKTNVTEAEKFGFRPYQFTSVEELRAELRTLGLV